MDVEALYGEHHAPLVRYLARLSGDPELAADAAQEAFVRLAERPPRDERDLRGWLFRVGTNLVRDAWRSDRRRTRLLAESGDAPAGAAFAAPDAAAERAELRRVVGRALQALSPRDRQILLMREEGFTHREIAAAVGTTTGSIGTLIARSLEKLENALPDAGKGVWS